MSTSMNEAILEKVQTLLNFVKKLLKSPLTARLSIVTVILSIATVLIIALTTHPKGAVHVSWDEYTQQSDSIKLAVYELRGDSLYTLSDSISSHEVEVWFNHPLDFGILLDGQNHYIAMKAYWVTTQIYSELSNIDTVRLIAPEPQQVQVEVKR